MTKEQESELFQLDQQIYQERQYLFIDILERFLIDEMGVDTIEGHRICAKAFKHDHISILYKRMKRVDDRMQETRKDIVGEEFMNHKIG